MLCKQTTAYVCAEVASSKFFSERGNYFYWNKVKPKVSRSMILFCRYPNNTSPVSRMSIGKEVTVLKLGDNLLLSNIAENYYRRNVHADG